MTVITPRLPALALLGTVTISIYDLLKCEASIQQPRPIPMM